MGTDIHAIWQARKNGRWVDISSTWNQDRHYFLFAWLADVRNGYGFAGVPTHAPIVPIAKRRGLPDDFIMNDEDHPCTMEAIYPERRKYMNEEEKKAPRFWMGDHSHSWLTGREILAAARPGTAHRVGVVERKIYELWDGKTAPADWCGMIDGKGILVVDALDGPHPRHLPDDCSHVRIRFDTDDGLQYFVDEVSELQKKHGEVRLVFGFDS